MSYLVIETWPDLQSASIMTEDGVNMVFDDEKEAETYRDAECQNGRVVKV